MQIVMMDLAALVVDAAVNSKTKKEVSLNETI